MKKTLFILICSTLCFTAVYQLMSLRFPTLNAAELKGFIEKVPVPTFTFQSFTDLHDQKKAEKYVKQELAIYPFAVRLNNQLRYLLFDELRSGIIEGKEGFLFETMYTDELLGKNFIGKDSIMKQAARLRDIIDTLDTTASTKVVLVLAINKADLHRNKLPSSYKIDLEKEPNYNAYLDAFRAYDIPFLDLNAHFKKIAQGSPHPLTNKNGIHWTKYGALIAADTIHRSIEERTGNALNSIVMDSIRVTDIPEKEDVDIAESLNLLQAAAPEQYSYPEFYLKPDSAFHKPKVLMIGDSFGWTIWNQYVPHEYWDPQSNFLYYNKTMWQVSPTDLHGSWTKAEQRKQLAREAEVLLLLYSTANLNDLGSGFLEEF